MFGTVDAATLADDGTTTVELSAASLDEVFDEPVIDWDADLHAQPVLDPAATGPLAHAQAVDGVTTMAMSPKAFECKTTGGVPLEANELWHTGNPMPITVEIENVKTVHNFDPGSLFPARKPSLILQVSGETVVTVGLTVKRGFSCELSSMYRRSHRLFSAVVGTVHGVPLNLFLEPAISFEVAASGDLEFEQRDYWVFTADKHGDTPLEFRRSGARDPGKVSGSIRGSASAFAGADLSLAFGGGNVSSGMFVALGPELRATYTAVSTASRPNCLDFSAAFRATGGVRLDFWVKRWELELGSVALKFAQTDQHCWPDDDGDGDEPGDFGSGQSDDLYVARGTGTSNFVTAVSAAVGCPPAPSGSRMYFVTGVDGYYNQSAPYPPDSYLNMGSTALGDLQAPTEVGEYTLMAKCAAATDVFSAMTAPAVRTFDELNISVIGPRPDARLSRTSVRRGEPLTLSTTCTPDTTRDLYMAVFLEYADGTGPHVQSTPTFGSGGNVSLAFTVPRDAPSGAARAYVECGHGSGAEHWSAPSRPADFTIS